MKFLLTLFIFVNIFTLAKSQNNSTVVRTKFTASSLLNNKVGETAEKTISIYLPPGYHKGKQHYPAIYFLHGYFGNDSLLMNVWLNFKQLMDTAIIKGKIKPVIVVAPNSETKLGGSFYTNSTVAGNWADYIGKDVVNYMDKNYRTIAKKEARGLSGHSMGGNGALKLAMQFPDVFGVVYAMSPAVLNWHSDFTVQNPAFKMAVNAKNDSEVMSGINSFEKFYSAVFSAMARAYSSNISATALKADFPVKYINDTAVINNDIKAVWEAQFPYNQVDKYQDALRSLVALKMDWGRNDEFIHIPFTALEFSKKLESLNIHHFSEEYLGTHSNMQNGFTGRVYTDMIPFFDMYFK